ncbi:MAG: fatty acid-binding protein DegV [Candidatus Aminicenantes bacterium]|nr:fatty acid-binding protein DegV [Candidatus Aminicenantes bacterium]
MKIRGGRLTGKGYYYAFLAGAKRILENQKELNRINVFPVPDADTGSNLASTVRAIIERVRPHRSYKVTSTAIAAAALEGARGNSGVILAQFLYGLGAESRDASEISLAQFAQSARSAVRHMYEAIANPMEGTMITVIRQWAESVDAPKEESESFLKVLTRAQVRAVEALQETRHRLEAMRRANVVDAGSKGVVLFLEGMIDFLVKPSHKKLASVRGLAVEIEDAADIPVGDVRFRYCTEALIRPRPGAAGLDKDALKRAIEGFGDSLVIAGSPEALRFHIHTDTPADLFFKIRDAGVIARQKADDMVRQSEAAHRRKWPIALVTDSTCDLPQALLDRYQVHVVPVQLSFGDSPYLDKVTITPDQFYTMLDERPEYPKTAQPAPQAFESLYTSLAGHYDSIVAVHLSQKLSGTYSNSLTAAARVAKQTGKTITVVDSKTLSGALGLLVLRLARLIEAGQSHDEVVAAAERGRSKARILVGVRTLKYMVRSGRVSPMAGVVAKLLNLKPIVSVSETGESKIFDKAFSQKGILRKTLRHLRAALAAGRVRDYGILHAHNPKDAEAYAAEVEAVIGAKPAFIMDISPAIGANAGVGTVAVSFLAEG